METALGDQHFRAEQTHLSIKVRQEAFGFALTTGSATNNPFVAIKHRLDENWNRAGYKM